MIVGIKGENGEKRQLVDKKSGKLPKAKMEDEGM